MSEANPAIGRSSKYNWLVALAYVTLALLFGWAISHFHIPGKGLTSLIAFGDKLESHRLAEVRQLDYYVERASDGYDAQFYAQIAMDPSLRTPGLSQAVDSLAYRARRILFCATAYGLGLGQPGWILKVFALQNTLCWFGLAWLLLHWFPPVSWSNLLRWAGVLGSLGMCASVRNSLMDGPSLLVVGLGVYFWEINRPRSATVLLALGGLGKETNVLVGSLFLPAPGAGRRAWGQSVMRGALIIAPLLLWLAYIAWRVGPATNESDRNFALPLFAYVGKWQEIRENWVDLRADYWVPVYSVLMMVSLTVQLVYLVLRPEWNKAWWRIGASFALLMVCLGSAVWEGFPGAAARVLLPMQLAFNVLVPAGRRWFVVLFAGNLSLLIAPYMLQPPPGEGYLFAGNQALRSNPAGHSLRVEFSDRWSGPEHDGPDYWCWSSGTAAVTLRNPHPEPLLAQLHFSLTAMGVRTIRIRVNGTDVWQAGFAAEQTMVVKLPQLALNHGANQIEFITDAPPLTVPHDDRLFAFSLYDLQIELLRLQAAPTGH